MSTDGYVDTYYSRSISQSPPRSYLRIRQDCESCVVGGGLAGIATALGLAERGRDVVLLEANRIGWGASGRNGGFLSAGYSLGSRVLANKLGLSRARELHTLSKDAVFLIQDRVRNFNIDGGKLKAGIVRNSWFNNTESVLSNISYTNENFDGELEYWPRERVAECYLSPRYYDAIFNPHAYQIHPLNYALACARAAEDKGARIFEGTQVVKLRRTASRHVAVTKDSEVYADNLILCCSGHGSWLSPRLKLANLGIGTYVVLTEPLGHRLETAIRAPYAASDNRRIENYYRVLPDTRLLWGGGMSISCNPTNLAESMMRDLFNVYPQLYGLKAELAWAGIMGYARHRMPQIGLLRPGIWFNQSFGGHGLNTTTMGGELIARAIAEDDRTYQAFAPFGLDFTGGPAGLLAAQTVYWWWKLLDMIDARQSS